MDPVTPATGVAQPPNRSLSSAIGRVATASAVGLVIGELVSFAQTVALARLLTPTQVGVFVAGTVLTLFVGNVVEGGLRAALVQREDRLDEATETVFWVTFGNGVAMAVVLFLSARIVGAIYGDPLVGRVAAATAGVLVLHSLTNAPEALLQRNFNVWRRIVVGPVVSLAYAVTAVTLAAGGWGVWALVAGLYASNLAWVISLWALCRWRPGRARPSWQLWREMAGFGWPLLVGMIAYQGRSTVEAFTVGRLLETRGLGFFQYGQRIAKIPLRAIVEMASVSLFPAFSRMGDDPERLRRAYLRALHWTMVAGAAATGLMIALGEPAVVMLFGEPWRPSGRALVAMSAIGVGYAMATVSEELIKARGRTVLLNWCTAVEVFVGLGSLVSMVLLWGLLGGALSLSVTALVLGGVTLALAQRVVPTDRSARVRALLPPVLAAAVATVVIWGTQHALAFQATTPLWWRIGQLGLESMAFTVIHLAVLSPFDRSVPEAVLRRIGLVWGRVSGRDRQAAR